MPDKVLHLMICLVISLWSWEAASGLAVGRESGNIPYKGRYRDSLNDLLCDVAGIIAGIMVKCLWT